MSKSTAFLPFVGTLIWLMFLTFGCKSMSSPSSSTTSSTDPSWAQEEKNESGCTSITRDSANPASEQKGGKSQSSKDDYSTRPRLPEMYEKLYWSTRLANGTQVTGRAWRNGIRINMKIQGVVVFPDQDLTQPEYEEVGDWYANESGCPTQVHGKNWFGWMGGPVYNANPSGME